MNKFVSLLYTVIIPLLPLGLHIFINILTNISIKLEYIYPELFFATISICVESVKVLQEELKYNNIKQLIYFMLIPLFIISSVSYGSVLVVNNLFIEVINVDVAVSTSFTIFLCSILLHMAIIIIKET